MNSIYSEMFPKEMQQNNLSGENDQKKNLPVYIPFILLSNIKDYRVNNDLVK
jgi:hypothetical protein